MSEEFPTNNPENQESNLSGAEMLTDMPSFEEMRRQNAVPEGVRDEQDYQEYLEEKQALANESFAIQKELIDKKNETLSSFENRLEANKDFYNELAEEAATIWCLFPDVSYYAYGGRATLGGFTPKIYDEYGRFQLDRPYGSAGATREENQQFKKELHLAYAFRDAMGMMDLLKDGVEEEKHEIDDVIDNGTLSKPYDSKQFWSDVEDYKKEHPDVNVDNLRNIVDGGVRDTSAKDIKEMDDLYSRTTNLVVPVKLQKLFENYLKGYFISKMDCEYDESFTKEQIDEARQKAREMMDGNKWHEALDDILNSYMDIDKFKEADDLLSELDMSTNDTTFNTGIGWHGSNLRPDFIPSMEDIYGLWSKIIKIQDKITNWFEETYQRIDNNCEHNIKMRNLILSQGNPSNSAIPQETGE